MIREKPRDFLQVLKSSVPDAHGLSRTGARDDYAEFYLEYQTQDRPSTEEVMIRENLSGVWCSVPESVADRVILFFHGGGFCVGSTVDHLGLCTQLARVTRSRVFSVDYRLSPENIFPAPVEDALSAYGYLTGHNYLPHHIIPVGISNGATLVLDLILLLRERRLPIPPAAICMSPFVDMTFGGESITANAATDWLTVDQLHEIRTVYYVGKDLRDPLVSPVNANLSGLCPLYLQAGTSEILFNDIAAFAKKAKWAGVPVRFEIWEDMFHEWQLFSAEVPEAYLALSRIGTFVQDILNR
ncbi:MAG: alpha/beta hydrolase fold domain-containing protein [Methanoregula sp.]|jgi:acetyl esterase/lipase